MGRERGVVCRIFTTNGNPPLVSPTPLSPSLYLSFCAVLCCNNGADNWILKQLENQKGSFITLHSLSDYSFCSPDRKWKEKSAVTGNNETKSLSDFARDCIDFSFPSPAFFFFFFLLPLSSYFPVSGTSFSH